MDGLCPLAEFFSLYDMEEEDERFDANTVGGWVTEEYGGIPPVGETILFKGIEIKVVKTSKQQVQKVRSKLHVEEKED